MLFAAHATPDSFCVVFPSGLLTCRKQPQVRRIFQEFDCTRTEFAQLLSSLVTPGTHIQLKKSGKRGIVLSTHPSNNFKVVLLVEG